MPLIKPTYKVININVKEGGGQGEEKTSQRNANISPPPSSNQHSEYTLFSSPGFLKFQWNEATHVGS